MTDTVSRERRSEIMSKIHQPTKLETKVHNWLCGTHIGHEMYPRIEGYPDIRIKGNYDSGDLYVFIDGCFWHRCPLHYRRPKSNRGFWIRHIEEAEARREKRRERLPYRWVRIWEHNIKDGNYKGMILHMLESDSRWMR